ncbi:hypothetical protein [Anabaena sp. UHCC 0451]|uniref:hypothetical protein n=1 Tax=Anabaena sp. UHCC 0451 TaxID=2055235 RepID=UPI002B218DC3|nr:hypothetical protein [Anabaena sp. UHCC 0451]MEA5577459.1 hypothetical protein [Anabaena sp. UHCC 0451]
MFIAAFNLGKWTFPFPNEYNIPRIAGKEFWNMIYIDYDIFEKNIRDMLQKIDQAFSELARK